MHKVRIDTIPLTGCQVLAGDDRIPGRWRTTLCHRERQRFVVCQERFAYARSAFRCASAGMQRGITLTQLSRGDTGRGS